ncbi:uncharacterized protein LOC123263476 isoform X3 [Cotesia glomerata]|uniref:uncharacterized protein LOC123263476 isoform X3 n=1 Tax=Cotesia glomerata TaxID=32391 RepID=UPI001D029E63|nr:uncharacterized protein LOC123263476 isoform X3 [Cotesia glomerata]
MRADFLQSSGGVAREEESKHKILFKSLTYDNYPISAHLNIHEVSLVCNFYCVIFRLLIFRAALSVNVPADIKVPEEEEEEEEEEEGHRASINLTLLSR